MQDDSNSDASFGFAKVEEFDRNLGFVGWGPKCQIIKLKEKN